LDKESSSSSTTAEALTARGIGSNHQKRNGDVGEFKPGYRKLGKKQCAFCRKEGHKKIDYPRLKKEKEQKSEANFAQADNGIDSNSSVLSLSIALIVCYSEESEWILDMGVITFVPNGSSLLVLKN